MQELAADLKLANVEFAGHMRGAELDRAIANSRFTVLPSHAYETLGKTILESYAEARAVVATDLGSRRELVQAGKTGLLYRTGDVEQLVSAIRFLGEQPELTEKMGLEGRERVRQKYTPEAHYAALVSLYERLVEGGWQSSDAPKQKTIRKTALTVATLQVQIRRGDGDGFVPLQRLMLAPTLPRTIDVSPVPLGNPEIAEPT